MAAPDLPQWATSPAADVAEPDGTKKAIGWVEEEIPPVNWFNWLFLQIYRCLAFLYTNKGSRQFATKADLISALEVGEAGVVTFAGAPPPFNRVWSYAHADPVIKVVADGVRVYAATSGGKIYAHDAETGALIWSYPSSTSLFSVVGLACDGEAVFVHEGGPSPTLYAINASTGATLQAEPNPYTSNPGEITCGGSSLYVLRRDTTGPQYSVIHTFDKADLSAGPASRICAEIVNAIVYVDGRFVAAGIDASVSGYSTGVFDLDADTFSVSDAIGTPDDGDSISYDGSRIWVGTSAATAFYGSGFGSRPVFSPDLSSALRPAAKIASNGEFVARAWSSGGVNFAEIGIVPSSPRLYTAALAVAAPTVVLYNGGADALNAVAVDEIRAFFGGAAQTAISGSPTLFAYSLPPRPRVFKRISASDETRLAWTGLAYG